jgi:hypothetical protein
VSALSGFEHPGEYEVVPFHRQTRAGAAQPGMVRQRIALAETQELAQRQTVSAAPLQAVLAVDAFEGADQQHAEIAARWQRRTTAAGGAGAGALRFTKPSNPALISSACSRSQKTWPGERGNSAPLSVSDACRSRCRPNAIRRPPLSVSATSQADATLSTGWYLGGERTGGKRGRGAAGKTPFVAAVETTPDGKPVRLPLRRVAKFCKRTISGYAKRSLDPNCEFVSDDLNCFGGVTNAGCKHEVIKTGSGPAAARAPAFKLVNTVLGNVKAAILGSYCSIHEKHVPRYIAKFEYRFDRRYDLGAMLPRLTWAAVRTPPMPYRVLKPADMYA